jgi:hypothetical protein
MLDKEFIETNIKIQSNGCWEWAGLDKYLDKDGYVRINHTRLHRLSYELYKESNIGRLLVLHKCDNRKCLNPEHLFLGTQLDNVRDMIAKGRRPRVTNIGYKIPYCKRGHERTAQNTNSSRDCLQCVRIRNANRKFA